MASTRTFVFNDWRGGEFGDLGAAGAPPNSFTGRNVMRYRSGALGPRPGVKALAPAGLPVGALWGLECMRPTWTRGVVFGTANQVWGFTLSPLGAAEQLGPNIAVAPTSRQQFIRTGGGGGTGIGALLLAVEGDKAYLVDPVADNVVALTGSPAGAAISRFGVRLMIASTAANPRRVYYSAPDDPNTWPALNFFDVPQWEVVYMNEIRQRLVLGTKNGEWWALTGVPGVNDVLRRQQRGDLSPWERWLAARVAESVWYLPERESFPVQFTGVTVDKLRFRHLAGVLTGDDPDLGVASMPAGESVVIVDGMSKKGLVLHDGVWSVADFGVTPRFIAGTDAGEDTAAVTGPYVMCDGGGAAAAPQFWTFQPAIDRPGKVADTWAAPGDGSNAALTGTFQTREEWGLRGEDLVVRTVVVDFEKWNTGASNTNHMELVVRALHRYDDDGYADSAPCVWDEAPALTPADRTVDRRVFRVGDQGVAQGFQIVGSVRGCAIRAVTVVADVEDRR